MKYLHLICIALLCLLLACCGRKNATGTYEEGIDTLSTETGIGAENEVEAAKAKADSAAVETDGPKNFGKSQGAYIYVSKSKMRLYVVDSNDSVLYSCGIACGIRKGNKSSRGDYRTPEGHFTVNGIYESTDWVHIRRDGRKAYGCYGPRFLSLDTSPWTGIGIHGTNAPHSIGRRASEGCIRVLSQNILTIYKNYAYTGMTAIVGGENDPLPFFKGVDDYLNEPAVSDNATPASSITSTTETPEQTEIKEKPAPAEPQLEVAPEETDSTPTVVDSVS